MDAVIDLVSGIIEERTREIDELEKDLSLTSPDLVDDIMDDTRYYNFANHIFLWESCLWRLQGIFEGILDERFLPKEQDYRGLNHRLQILKKEGYLILNETDLLEWAKLRNILSHSPPKELLNGPRVPLTKVDVVEQRDFLVDILRSLEQQKLKLFAE